MEVMPLFPKTEGDTLGLGVNYGNRVVRIERIEEDTIVGATTSLQGISIRSEGITCLPN